MVAGMAPPPSRGIAHDHEGRNLVHRVVHPLSSLFLGREKIRFNLGPFSILDKKSMREATLAALVKTGVKIPNLMNTIRNMSGGQRQCVAIARTAAFRSKLVIMDKPTAALGVQEAAQVENIIRPLKEAGVSLILVGHNMRQVFDLVDRIVVFRRGRIVANLRKEDTNGQDVVAQITGAKSGAEFEGSA
jgi:fructose transport system ATP-binding protein